jgi:hypothetical protein
VVASADDVALGVGVGVVVAEATLVTPSPAPNASAPAVMPSVILLVLDMVPLLNPPLK